MEEREQGPKDERESNCLIMIVENKVDLNRIPERMIDAGDGLEGVAKIVEEREQGPVDEWESHWLMMVVENKGEKK